MSTTFSVKIQLLLSRVFIIPFFRSNVNKYSRNLEYFAVNLLLGLEKDSRKIGFKNLFLAVLFNYVFITVSLPKLYVSAALVHQQ